MTVYRKILPKELINIRKNWISIIRNQAAYLTDGNEKATVKRFMELAKELIESDPKFREFYGTYADNVQEAIKYVREMNNIMKRDIKEIKRCKTVYQLAYFANRMNFYHPEPDKFKVHDHVLYVKVNGDLPVKVFGSGSFTDCEAFIEWMNHSKYDYSKSVEDRIRYIWKFYDNQLLITLD